MKTSILSAGILLLAAMPTAHADPAHDRGDSPCFRVTIQTDRSNYSDVHQACDRNVSRTVQIGAWNRAQTRQTGQVNSNGVRQYHFDISRYQGWRRHHRR